MAKKTRIVEMHIHAAEDGDFFIGRDIFYNKP